MMSISNVWKWLSDEANRKILIFLGGAFVAIITGGWQIYQHLFDSDKVSTSKNDRNQSVMLKNTSGLAVVGDIQARDITIGITLEEYEIRLRNKEKMIRAELEKLSSADRLQKQALEKQLEVTNNRLEHIKKSYSKEKESLEHTAELLLSMKQSFDSESLDDAINTLKQGDTIKAEALLKQVLEEEKTNLDARRAAEQLITLVQLDMAQLDIAHLDMRTRSVEYYQRRKLELSDRPVEIFFDDFNSARLAGHWEVINPAADAFIVDKSQLLILNSVGADLQKDNVPNIFRLKQSLPDGDWVITARVQIDFQTNREQVFFGLYDDPQNFLVHILSTATGSCYTGGSYRYHLYGTAIKMDKGKLTQSQKELWNIKQCDGKSLSEKLSQGQPILLKFEKKDRTYTSSVKMLGDKDAEWKSSNKLTLIHPGGKLSFGVFQNTAKVEGETSFKLDWIKISSLTD